MTLSELLKESKSYKDELAMSNASIIAGLNESLAQSAAKISSLSDENEYLASRLSLANEQLHNVIPKLDIIAKEVGKYSRPKAIDYTLSIPDLLAHSLNHNNDRSELITLVETIENTLKDRLDT